MNKKIAAALLLGISVSLSGMEMEETSRDHYTYYFERNPRDVEGGQEDALLEPNQSLFSRMRQKVRHLQPAIKRIGILSTMVIVGMAAGFGLNAVLPNASDSSGWNPPPPPSITPCPRVEWNRFNVWADEQAAMTSRKDGIIQGAAIECQLIALNDYPCANFWCDYSKINSCAPVSWQDEAHSYVLMGDGSTKNISECTIEKGLTKKSPYLWCTGLGGWLGRSLRQFRQENITYCKTEEFGNEFGVVIDEEHLSKLVNMTKYQEILEDPSLMDEGGCTVYKYSAQLDANCDGPIIKSGEQNDSRSEQSIETVSFE